MQSLQELIERHQPGHTLERDFYTSEAIYQLDLEKVWGHHWHWVGHTSQLANTGDYLVYEFGQESVIVVRESADKISAHLNVCRHRGSRVCLSNSGNTRSFTCPYHAWTYNLDGSLRAGRHMPESFDKNEFALRAVSLLNYQNLLFISLSDQPPEFDFSALSAATLPFGLDKLKVAHQANYPVEANWKLAVENYMECYHCAPAHKDYARSHSLKDPAELTGVLQVQMAARATDAGLLNTEIWQQATADNPASDLYYRRYPLYPGYDSGSQSGNAVAPLLGMLRGFDGGASDIQIGPLNNFLAYSDHVVGYRFIPRGLQQTEIQTVWMVHEEAVEGTDYQLDDLLWLWHVTTLDDERIIRHNQRGVNSRHYQPGPLSTMEWGIVEFHKGYFDCLER